MTQSSGTRGDREEVPRIPAGRPLRSTAPGGENSPEGDLALEGCREEIKKNSCKRNKADKGHSVTFIANEADLGGRGL